MNAYLIAAASSGSGKTTLTMGILRALARRGIPVQPCKCGPDYIDTQYHHIACGRASYNIDPWMHLGDEAATSQALTVIEGCMGLFDGAIGPVGSNAEVAERLGVSIILVVNARSMAHSAAPLLYGYLHYRPTLRYAGVIFNNVGSPRHAQMLRRAADEVGFTVLACIPRRQELSMPSRHLGLDLSERNRISLLADLAADEVERQLDWAALGLPEKQENRAEADASGAGSPCRNEDAERLGTPAVHAEAEKAEASERRPLICVARDEAFNFIYQETLDRLQRLGRLHFFSPLANEPVPRQADFVYLPGGYPEFFLQRLAESRTTMESLRLTEARILAECGGMMYLGRSIDGASMTGLLPFGTTMQGARLHLGYRTIRLPDGAELRGHEFHYSSILPCEPAACCTTPFLDAHERPVETCLFHSGRIIASYVHWSPEAIVELLTGENIE
ncbi:MAG: cobyrinate a,c-diamide synthase [Bacteroidaceae bacterium]|nr:cobyrinate a,c-diamide synthase [Bacteroidaceae bacterium]